MMIRDFITSRIISSEIKKGEKALETIKEISLHAEEYQKNLLLKIVCDNKNTEYGKKNHFDQVSSVEEYKRLVPFSDYDTYSPYIERVINHGEKDLYTVYPIVTYALSSGSVGVPKKVPVSQEALNLYQQLAVYRMFGVSANSYKDNPRRKDMLHRAFTTLEVSGTRTKDGLYLSGCISGAVMEKFSAVLYYTFTSPAELIIPRETMDLKYIRALFALADRNTSHIISCFMTGIADEMSLIQQRWEQLCNDIEKGELSADILCSDKNRSIFNKALKADPARAEELRTEFGKGFDTPVIPRIWKKMTFLSSVGTGGFASYTEKMKKHLGPDIPIDYMAYAASEALMGVSVEVNAPEYVLLMNTAYYEFIPENAEDDSETLGVADLEVGKRYEVVLTNLSGFYRYKLKDVIEVTGWYYEAPKVCFAYRKSQLINIIGEKVTEGDLAWAVKAFSKETGIKINDYCVCADEDTSPGRYLVLLEADEDTPLDPAGLDEYSQVMDKKLGEANVGGYKYARDENELAPLQVLIQQPQTHALYREMMCFRGRSENQLKPVRVLDTPIKEKFFLNLVEK